MCWPSLSHEKYTGLSPEVMPHRTCIELPSTKSIGNEKPAIFGGSETVHMLNLNFDREGSYKY